MCWATPAGVAVLWLALSILLLLRAFVGFHLLQAAPFVLVVFVVIWKIAAHASRGKAATLRIALALLAVSFLVHVAAPGSGTTLGYQRHSWEYQIRGMIKHGRLPLGLDPARERHRRGGRAPRA